MKSVAVAVWCITLCLAALCVTEALAKLEPDVFRNGVQLIQSHGYIAEEYTYETSDHYLLKLIRIPCARDNCARGGPPVFMMHALLCSSDEWILNQPNQSLGFVLADAGFDVWMANKRGNTYSCANTVLSKDDPEFWDWSYDQVGAIDIPEQIDFVLKQTGYSSLGYVGHSEGTTAGMIAASNPATYGKINSLVLLAPVGNVTNAEGNALFTEMAKLGSEAIFKVFGQKNFLSQTPLLKNYGPVFCEACSKCCEDILFFFCGFSPSNGNFNSSRFPVYYSHTPSGTSTQNMVHWLQSMQTHLFRMYDYGSVDENFKHYKQITPPYYDITLIPQQLPIALFAGSKDTLATPDNVQALMDLLPTTTYLQVEPTYEHMDFTWGLDANTKIFPGVVDHLKMGL